MDGSVQVVLHHRHMNLKPNLVADSGAHDLREFGHHFLHLWSPVYKGQLHEGASKGKGFS